MCIGLNAKGQSLKLTAPNIHLILTILRGQSKSIRRIRNEKKLLLQAFPCVQLKQLHNIFSKAKKLTQKEKTIKHPIDLVFQEPRRGIGSNHDSR
jgi:hypothetical protein